MSASSPVITIEVGDENRRADVRASLRRLYSTRLLWRAIGEVTMALACALAALCVMAFVDYGWSVPRAARLVLLSLVLLAALFFLARSVRDVVRRRTLAEVAREVERATGSRRNALVTFAESASGADRLTSEGYMLARLERQARGELEEIDERLVAPREAAVRGALALAFMLLLIFALLMFAPLAFAREVGRVLWLAGDEIVLRQRNEGVAANVIGANAGFAVDELRVRVVPPSYSGLSVEEVSGDAPVRALSGSQIEVVLHVNGAIEDASLSFNGSANQMRSLGERRFSGAFTANVSGAFEARVHANDEGSAAPAPIVRAVEVYTDAPPEARIVEPASDQLLRSVPGVPVNVRWTARDDLGLAGVALKYIKSRGEGDSAKFTNGEIGTGSVSRASVRDWQGAARLDLQRLDMQPGDTLVFWLEARDRRSAGANNTGRSASLAIAIAGPELAKLNLSDLMPNEIGRFLLSERAIIMHTEKLHTERARLSKEELGKRSNDIAAEQREFKNSFNDYIHIEGAGEDEGSGAAQSIEEQVRAAEDERTAPHFHGIPEPPTAAPTAVKEMTYAIRAMWDAEDALANTDTAQALKYERDALVRLKRAQGATRYVPPIVAQSQPVDLKRRYAGELEEIKTRLEKLARRPQSPASQTVRAALAELYAALDDLQETLGGASANIRVGAIGRAREGARAAADRLVAEAGGNHAATIAEAAGQLRVVEMELARMEAGGTSDEYATRLAKPLALLTQAASNLFAIAESSTRALSNDANQLLPVDDARAADYFRRLAGGK
jgi:hypothetical protein